MTQPDQGTTRSDPQSAAASAELADEELLDLLRRERADFLNYRRRIERERTADRDRSTDDVLERLIPVLVELDRAVAYIPGDLAVHPWVQGVGLSREKLAAAYRDLGVTRVGREGEPFDPERHEALSYDVREDVEEPTVSSVIVTGYQHGDRLLRPARVAVSGPAAVSPTPEDVAGTPEERPAGADATAEEGPTGG